MDFSNSELLAHLFLTGYTMNAQYSTHFQPDHRILRDSSKFWKSISPLFSEKAFRKKLISFLSEDKIIIEETKVFEKFYNYFKKLQVQTK